MVWFSSVITTSRWCAAAPNLYLCSGSQPAKASLNNDNSILTIIKHFSYCTSLFLCTQLNFPWICIEFKCWSRCQVKLIHLDLFCDIILYEGSRTSISFIILLIVTHTQRMLWHRCLYSMPYGDIQVRLYKKSNSRLLGIYSLEINVIT